jgi:Zn-dependent protease/predicted transcriptional regulator
MSQPARQRPVSPWSFRIAKVSGIPIRLHFTFLLFVALIASLGAASGGVKLTLFILLLFFCILLHELGHALTAQRFGIKTRDITLYPIGGVAMLEGRPKPKEELWITLAGPAVNVVIALFFAGYLLATRQSIPPVTWRIVDLELPQALFVANVSLALFNMIPAFPMDGGRVLRALLALRMGERQATQIAGGIGQLLAIVLGLVAIFTGNLMLMLVAFFVFVGAGQETSATVGISFLQGHRAKDAMITKFQIVESGWTLDIAAKLLLEGSQQDFPVVIGNQVIGVLARGDIARGLASDGPQAYIAGHMRREFKRVEPETSLEEVATLVSNGDPSPCLVMEGDKLFGMVTAENLSEFIMLAQARSAVRAN